MPYLPHTNPDHDEGLVARLAADDLPGDEPEGRLARAWVAECPACAELARDLQAIALATAALPPPNRTRDFRLTEADAARLRPRGWRGLVAQFGSPTFAFTRPLAAGLATLGIAGLLLATLPSGFGSASSSSGGLLSPAGSAVGAQDSSSEYGSTAPQPGVAAGVPSAAPAAAPSAAGPIEPAPAASAALPEAASPTSSGYGRDILGSSPLPDAGGGVSTQGGSKGVSSPATGTGGANPAAAPPGETSRLSGGSGGGPSPLVVLSVALLVIGIGLGALRIVARRVA